MGGASSAPTRDKAKEEKSIEKNESASAPVAKQEKTVKAVSGPASMTSRNLPMAAPAQSNKSEPVASNITKTSVYNDNYSDRSATAAYESKINGSSVVEEGKSSPALDEPNRNLTPDESKQEDTPAIQVDENESSATPDESKNAAADARKNEIKKGSRVQMGGGLSPYNSFVTIVAATREKHVAFPNGEDLDTLESARNEIVRLRTHLLKIFDEFEAVKRQEDATTPSPNIANKGDNEMDDHLEKFMQSGSISTWVLLQNCAASKECLGPIAISLQLNQASQRLAEQNSQIASFFSVLARTRAELHYKQKMEEHKSLLDKQDIALKNLTRVRFDVASQIGRKLIDDVLRYQNAMDAIEASESKICAELHEFAASIVNTSPLKKGSVVEVAEQGRFQRARVERDSDGMAPVSVSLWMEVVRGKDPYEEG